MKRRFTHYMPLIKSTLHTLEALLRESVHTCENLLRLSLDEQYCWRRSQVQAALSLLIEKRKTMAQYHHLEELRTSINRSMEGQVGMENPKANLCRQHISRLRTIGAYIDLVNRNTMTIARRVLRTL